MMSNTTIQYHILRGFDDAKISPTQWNALLQIDPEGPIFMTWHYQKVWWESFGRGKLLLVFAMKDEMPIAIAPLFVDEGMIYFVGSGGSDYLNFIGDVSNPIVIETMLLTAIEDLPAFAGFLFYHVPGMSLTKQILNSLAEKQGWYFCNEGEMAAPYLSIKECPQQAVVAIDKKSLIRHEAWFIRNGKLEIAHASKNKEILPYLTSFFEQHISRWASTPFPSLFLDKRQQQFYNRLAEVADETGWLRFTTVTWNEQPIAYHFGFMFNGSFLWYKPSFDINLSKHSPGEVLLRNLLINALAEGALIFDFGLGDESFKSRFASHTKKVENLGLYPNSASKENL